ncbi:hypothetical protein MJH12_20115 [bacterium]|nr:hypothetical protein [bacterium]
MRLQFCVLALFLNITLNYSNDLQIQVQSYLKKAPILSELTKEDQISLAELFASLGHQYGKKNKWVLSVIYYRKSLALDPENSQLILFAGMNYYKLKRYDKAQELFLQYKEVSKQHSWLQICDQYLFDTLSAKAEQLSKISLWDLAIKSYEDSLQYSSSAEKTANILSKIHYAYFQKGSFHFSQKHYLEASKNLVKALTPETNKSLVHKIERMAAHLFLNSAKHYEKEGKYLESLKYYQSIVDYFKSERSILYSQKRIKALQEIKDDSSLDSDWISE